MPLIHPLLEARMRRHWQVLLAAVVCAIFTAVHAATFQGAALRYDRAVKRATDMGLAVDPTQPLIVTPPRLLVVLAANMLPADVASSGRESGALGTAMLEELTQLTRAHGMTVLVQEPGLTSQDAKAVQIRAHLKVQCSYPQFVSFLDDLTRQATLISVDRFTIAEGRDGRTALDLWVTRYVIKQEPPK